jgi:hypothetical protein
VSSTPPAMQQRIGAVIGPGISEPVEMLVFGKI